jgi:glycogen(starch) synthase
MNILWLTENYPPQRGGMAQSCDRIIEHLRKCGHAINVLHLGGHQSPYQLVTQLNGWYASVPVEESESHMLNRAWEFIRERPVSMLVCFGGYLPMLAAPVFAKWLGLPLITMIRGNDFDAAVFTPRKRDVLGDAITASKIVTVVSRDKAEKVRLLYPEINVQYVPNGIDCNNWKPTVSEELFAQDWRSKNSPGKIYIGLFGQLKAKKGVHFLFEALQQSGLTEQLHFLLVGDINDEVQHQLVIHEFGFSSFSFLDRYELLKYYLCCDAIAIPSFYDGMPNVLLEAGALGIPVIASQVDGMKDIIEHKQNGLLFKAGDAASCRRAFLDFVSLEVADRKKLGINLKSTIESNYNVELETNHYEKLFKTLLDIDRSAVRLHAR